MAMGYFTRYNCEMKYHLRFKILGFSNPAPMKKSENTLSENAELSVAPKTAKQYVFCQIGIR